MQNRIDMRRFAPWLAVAATVVVVGCGDGGATGSLDLSATTFADLAVPIRDGGIGDFANLPAPSYDLAWSACIGTPLAGTCVEKFFEGFVACFQPVGHCRTLSHNSASEACWQNGAYYVADHFVPKVTEYRMGTNSCLRHYYFAAGHVPSESFCGVDDATCGIERDDGGYDYTPKGTGARYDRPSGIFTCPDGTKVDIGPNLGGCAALDELLSPFPLCDDRGNFGVCGRAP